MSRRRVAIITVGVIMALFMAAVESTVVATAMPTIISQLGGLSIYSWVFSAYMLASTTTVPIYGKLSDLYGRRPIFMISMGIFLVGSFLSGHADSMTQLILFRGLQGLGAGGILPLAFIIIGDLFTFEQRARMQGLFSGVWGVAAIAGPLLGGFLVDRVSWHWVFYVNIGPGILATALVGLAWRERAEQGARRPSIDFLGTGLLSAAVIALLLGLFDLGAPASGPLLALALALFACLLWAERRAADPVLPLPLFRRRLFAVACAHGLLAGWCMFGSSSFVPLFAQGVLGTSATVAGTVLTPQALSWTLASIAGSRLLLHYGYRTIALAGMVMLAAGTFAMSRVSPATTLPVLMTSFAVMGIGMGLSMPAFLIAVQSDVPRKDLGTATSAVQFSRNIGGTLGVSVMGVVLSSRLAAGLSAVGIDPSTVSVDAMAGSGPVVDAAVGALVRAALSNGIRSIFVVALAAAVIGLLATALAPGGKIARRPGYAAREEAESGNL